MQLGDRIATLVEAVAPPLSLDEIEVRTLPKVNVEIRRPRWTQLAAAAAAVAVAIGVGTTIAVSGNDNANVATSELGSSATTYPPLPAPLDELEWTSQADPFPALDSEASTVVADMVASGDRVWAVGFEWKFTESLETKKRGAIWQSIDGFAWEPIVGPFGNFDASPGTAIPAGTSFDHLVVADGQPLAFGNDFSDTVTPVGVRLAEDGTTWERTDFGALGGQLLQVDSHGSRLAALIAGDLSGRRQAVGIIESTDAGVTWAASAIPIPISDDGHLDVALDATRTVIIDGYTAWSRDHGGTDWLESTITSGSDPFSFIDVATFSDGFVVSRSSTSSGVAHLSSFTSMDGQSWIPASSFARGLTATDGSAVTLSHSDGVSMIVNIGLSSAEPVRLFEHPEAPPTEHLGVPLPFNQAAAVTVLDDAVLILELAPVAGEPPSLWRGTPIR